MAEVFIKRTSELVEAEEAASATALAADMQLRLVAEMKQTLETQTQQRTDAALHMLKQAQQRSREAEQEKTAWAERDRTDAQSTRVRQLHRELQQAQNLSMELASEVTQLRETAGRQEAQIRSLTGNVEQLRANLLRSEKLRVAAEAVATTAEAKAAAAAELTTQAECVAAVATQKVAEATAALATAEERAAIAEREVLRSWCKPGAASAHLPSEGVPSAHKGRNGNRPTAVALARGEGSEQQRTETGSSKEMAGASRDENQAKAELEAIAKRRYALLCPTPQDERELTGVGLSCLGPHVCAVNLPQKGSMSSWQPLR